MITARMKGRVTALLLGLGATAITAGHAQSPVNKYNNPLKHPPKPTTAAITAEELRTRLYIFADDSMEGRQFATVGNMKGTAYIGSELKRLGIEPGGDNGGYFQRLPYVHRMFTNRSTMTVGGSPFAMNTDFVTAPGATAPAPISGAIAIFGGVEGDTTRQITAAQAAGKFVIMSVSANPQGGGRGAGGGGNAPPPLPAGCPLPQAGAGRGGAGGGRGGQTVGTVSAATQARFADAVAIGLIDLDGLSANARSAITNPLTASLAGGAGGGRGGRGGAPDPAALAAARVPTPNPDFKAVAGDLIVTNGNGIAVVRNGSVVSGTLPSGWTPAIVKAKSDSMAKKTADSTAMAMARRDTIVATAQRLVAAGSRSGTAMFHGTAIPLDSTQIVTLGCAPAGGGRGAAGGGNRGGGGRNGGTPAGATAAPPPTYHLTSSAVGRIFGNRMDGLQPGATGGAVTANLAWVEEPSDWARNVIGIVRGSDPKLAGEYVAIGAHNDHNGIRQGSTTDHDSLKAFNDAVLRLRMQVVKGDLLEISAAQRASIHVNMDSIRKLHPIARMDSVLNGADDDGSGSMGVLEIAEAVAKMPVKPKRSIIFIWHTGEEAGLNGSRYWTDNPTVPIDSVVAQINIDMIGRGRAEDMVGGGPTYLGAVGSKRLSTPLNKEMLAVNAAEAPARRLRIDYRFDDQTLGVSQDGKPASWPGYNSIYTRSDHYNYARKCIPIVFFFTGLHGDYHQLTDEPQYIDYPHYSLISNYIRDLLVDVANKPARPALDNVCTRL